MELSFYSPKLIPRLLLALALIGLANLNASTSIQMGDSTGTAGSSIVVPLQLFTSDVVSAAQIDLFADPDIAEIASVSGSDAGLNHIVDSEALSEEGMTRVVVYSTGNDNLFTEALVEIQLVLRTGVGINDRSIIVEAAMMSDAGADPIGSTLVPNATFAGPDASVVYQLGSEVLATGVAYDTNGSAIDRFEILVDGIPVAADTEAPYEVNFPLEYFSNITIGSRAVDNEGNFFNSVAEDYMVTFPSSLENWTTATAMSVTAVRILKKLIVVRVYKWRFFLI